MNAATDDRRDLQGLFRKNIQKMAAYVPGEQPQGGKFIKLNTNENPYPPSPKVKIAIQQAAEGKLERYPDPLGQAFCRRAAEVYGVDPDCILCGNGSDDILTILTRAFVDPGAKLRLPYPSYILYKTLAEIQGANSQEVAFSPEYGLTPEFLRDEQDLQFVFLPNPNSPSGTIVPKDDIRKLAASVECPLLVDEAYADFADENCIDLIQDDPRIMVSRTLSKSYGLAGLRFGFLIADPAVVAMLRKVKDSYNCDAISIAAATAAIDDQQWFTENRQRVLATRQRMAAELQELGFTVTESHANFVWCTMAGRQLKPIYEALKRHGVLIRYMNYEGWGEGLRISVGTNDQIDAFLAILKLEM